MKWFFLILMAATAATIFYFRDEIRGKIDQSTSTGSSEAKEEVIASGDGAGDRKAESSKAPAGGDARSKTTTPPTKPVDPRADKTEDPNDVAVKRYPMPQFKTIEQAVGDWNAIPPSAFPRQVTIKKPVKIVLPGGVGSSTARADSKMYALTARGATLTVGMTNTASARGQIGIDDTDFKQILGREFDAWKLRQRDIVNKKRARYRSIIAQTGAATSASPSRNSTGLLAYEKELGKKPEQLTDGSVPVMLASLKRKDVSEITPDIIQGWGPVIREEVDNKAYWTATVEYKTVSMFGELNTEAQALMLNGKVIKWIYTGSGESVP